MPQSLVHQIRSGIRCQIIKYRISFFFSYKFFHYIRNIELSNIAPHLIYHYSIIHWIISLIHRIIHLLSLMDIYTYSWIHKIWHEANLAKTFLFKMQWMSLTYVIENMNYWCPSFYNGLLHKLLWSYKQTDMNAEAIATYLQKIIWILLSDMIR